MDDGSQNMWTWVVQRDVSRENAVFAALGIRADHNNYYY